MLHLVLRGEPVVPVVPLLRKLEPLFWRKMLVRVRTSVPEEKQKRSVGGILVRCHGGFNQVPRNGIRHYYERQLSRWTALLPKN